MKEVYVLWLGEKTFLAFFWLYVLWGWWFWWRDWWVVRHVGVLWFVWCHLSYLILWGYYVVGSVVGAFFWWCACRHVGVRLVFRGYLCRLVLVVYDIVCVVICVGFGWRVWL